MAIAKVVAKRILKNIAKMFLTKTVALWALRLAAESTKNKVDDNIVKLAKAGYENNPEQMMIAGEALMVELKKEYAKHKEEG